MAAYEAVGDLTEDGDAIAAAIGAEADAIVFEATEDHGRLATFGLEALAVPEDRPLRILTHCNTGPLACGQFGTALGRRPGGAPRGPAAPRLGRRDAALPPGGAAHDLGAGPGRRPAHADPGRRRRPPDGPRRGRRRASSAPDRIAANGDTANKVGTYTLAVLAARHGIPFYVAAPISTVDLATPDGDAIPIEERPADEVLLRPRRRASPRPTPRSATRRST